MTGRVSVRPSSIMNLALSKYFSCALKLHLNIDGMENTAHVLCHHQIAISFVPWHGIGRRFD